MTNEDLTGICFCVGLCSVVLIGVLNATPSAPEPQETRILPDIKTTHDAQLEEIRRQRRDWTMAEQVRNGWIWMQYGEDE